jgi:hypothetical protein
MDKTPMLSSTSSSLVRHSAEGRRHLGQVRHEWFAMTRHAPEHGHSLHIAAITATLPGLPAARRRS